MSVTPAQLDDLKKEIPYKWKVQTAREWGCECVAYIDARQVMDLLDEVVGPENWQDHYREVAQNIYCDLSIKVDGEWITKSDCGTESTFEAEKGRASDAFKRAAVKWGVGRFLYRLDMMRTKSMQNGQDRLGNIRYVPCDDKGKRIFNLSSYIRALQNNSGKGRKKTNRATMQQKEDMKKICQELGWSGAQLNRYLQQENMTWKTLTQEDAAKVLNELELILNVPDLRDYPETMAAVEEEEEGVFSF